MYLFISLQTAKPQERNPFVKSQKNQEKPNKINGKPAEKTSTDSTVLKSDELETEKDTAVKNSQKLKDTSNNTSTEKDICSSDSTNDTSGSTCDANNNRKRGYSLTEDQKEQLLSLLASAKLDKSSFVTADNERKSEEPSNHKSKAVEEQPVKPPSPSLYAYPRYAQTEAQAMFSPITPAGRSVSPSVQSDVSDSQIPAVPNFVPIAVPIPSVAPVPMPPFWYMPQGGMMPYSQPAMSPVQFVPVDPSVTSNQSVMSTDSDASEVSDLDSRSKKTSCAIPRFDKTVSENDAKQRTRRSSALQNNKGSKLPRPIWQTPVTKNRGTPVEQEANSNVIRRRTPVPDEFSEPKEEIKPVRARTPSPSLGKRSSPKVTTPPRSQTPPVNRTRDGVDMPANNKPQKRFSTGSLPSWRPPSPCSSPDQRRRSISSPSTSPRSRSNSPVQRPRSSSSRPSSPPGSRSNSPVSILVSKFEQMSQESSDNSPSVRSNSVSSMISKFGSSSLVPEDRIVKGQFKPNLSASAPQPASKTGPFRPSTIHDRTQAASGKVMTGNSISSRENPISRDRSSTSESSNADERSSISTSRDPREVHRCGSDPGSNDNRRERLCGESRRRLSSSLGNLGKESESSAERCEDSRTRLLQNVRKWSSQENIMRDSTSDALAKDVQERLISGPPQADIYSTKHEMLNENISTKGKPESRSSGNSSSLSPSRRRSSSCELKNELIIKPSNALDSVSKPWRTKDGWSTELTRKSSLDSEPVREKGSPKTRPRDICITPERDNSIQYCDIKGAKDFLWSPTSDTHKFEIPVDLAILESTTPTVSSPLSSVCGFDLSYGGREGSIRTPTAPLSQGSLKDFKPSNYFTSVTFKCGEMEPERDTNCLTRRPSRDSLGVSSDTVSNSGDPNVNYVRRFERKILRNTGDIEDELFHHSNAGSSGVQSVPSRDKSTPAKKSPVSSTSQEMSITTAGTSDSKNSRNHSRTDPILKSRHPSGERPSLSDRTPASTARNPPSPMTLRKLLSQPLPQEETTSRTKPSPSKRNSLPTSDAIHLSPDREPSNRPITKSSSQTNLSPSQKQVHKGSSQTNLSARQTAADFLSNYSSKKKDNGPLEKSSAHPKLLASNNPHPKGDRIKTKSSAINVNPGNPHASKQRQTSREPSKERNSHSSNPHLQAAKTKSTTSVASRNSECSRVRYPYIRRASMPDKGNSNIKTPPKAASNPTSPLYPKHPKDTVEFFGASGPLGSLHPDDPNTDQVNFTLKGAQDIAKARRRIQSSEGGSADSSGFGSSPMASRPGSFSKSSSPFVLPTRAQFLEQSSSATGDHGDSDIFYVPSSEETLPKSEPISAKATTKRFPSSSSSDSGLNMSDPDETRKGSRHGNKINRVWSPPTSPTSLSPSNSPGPTSPKFPIGSNIFYDPRDQQTTLPWSEKGSSDVPKEPSNLTNSSSTAQQNESSNPPKNSPAKSTESSNKTTRSDSDKFENLKGEVSKMQDKISLDTNERFYGLPEKPKDATAALKAVALAQIVKSTSKERLASSTPPPDIQGRPSSKSPPSSSRVDSKELLGQLVKKVLNSAAAKQGSSPKASFAEPTSSVIRDSGKGKRAGQGKMFFSPEEITEVEEKETSNRQGHSQTIDSSKHVQTLPCADKTSKKKEQGRLDSKEITATRNRTDITANDSAQSLPVASNETPVTPRNASNVASSSPEVWQQIVLDEFF